MGKKNAYFDQEEMKELLELTPFSEKEINKLMERYSAYDPSPQGEEGMEYDDCITMPEFVGNKLTPTLIKTYLDDDTGCIHPRQFLLMCATLSDKVSPEEKKEALFNLYDGDGTGLLTHDEIFRMYKSLFHGATTDNHILELTYIALKHPDLAKEGEITKEEFFRMLPDNEAYNRMTVDFQF